MMCEAAVCVHPGKLNTRDDDYDVGLPSLQRIVGVPANNKMA